MFVTGDTVQKLLKNSTHTGIVKTDETALTITFDLMKAKIFPNSAILKLLILRRLSTAVEKITPAVARTESKKPGVKR